jgi:DNA-directed RNA polymerase specialized sigma24 family protein
VVGSRQAQPAHTALPTLTPVQRDVLDLAYVTGLTQVEIAERLGNRSAR